MRRLNILVFPCGSEIGLEVHAALRYAKDIQTHGASSVSDHGEFVYARYRQIQAQAGSEDLVGQLNEAGLVQVMEAYTIACYGAGQGLP